MASTPNSKPRPVRFSARPPVPTSNAAWPFARRLFRANGPRQLHQWRVRAPARSPSMGDVPNCPATPDRATGQTVPDPCSAGVSSPPDDRRHRRARPPVWRWTGGHPRTPEARMARPEHDPGTSAIARGADWDVAVPVAIRRSTRPYALLPFSHAELPCVGGSRSVPSWRRTTSAASRPGPPDAPPVRAHSSTVRAGDS